MCLAVHKDAKILIANEDIIVYKGIYIEFDNKYKSPYQEYIYIKNKTYKNEHTIEKLSVAKEFFFDEEEVNIIKKSRIKKENIKCIKYGYHFAFSPTRLSNKRYVTKIVKCIIPKGSKYIIGIDKNLGVSDTIILL